VLRTTLKLRVLPAAAVMVGLLVAAPVAHAASDPVATIALGDKRPTVLEAKKTKAKAKKKAAKKKKAANKKKTTAKKSQAPVSCQDVDVLPVGGNLDAVADAILCLHNQIRAKQGLPLLKQNGKLATAAARHSSAMVNQGYFDHTSPDGTSFVERILDAGYVKRNDGWTLGENLAWGTGDLSTPNGLMDAWMKSSGHKANILKKAYREVGIGIRLGVPSDEGVGATVTVDFGAKA